MFDVHSVSQRPASVVCSVVTDKLTTLAALPWTRLATPKVWNFPFLKTKKFRLILRKNGLILKLQAKVVIQFEYLVIFL